MGNSISPKIENAQKTGVCSFKDMKLKELPPEVSQLPKTLRTLELSSNSLRILPDVIGQFTMLKTLSANQNHIAYISQEINKLVKLETLSLASNSLTGLDLPNAGNLKNLTTVNLSSNKLNLFPVDLCTLPALDALDLSGNAIAVIPSDIKTIKAIEINLNKNRLNKLNDGLSECKRLKVLRVEENCLDLSAMTEAIMKKSKICLLAFDGNTFDMKQFQDVDGYDDVFGNQEKSGVVIVIHDDETIFDNCKDSLDDDPECYMEYFSYAENSNHMKKAFRPSLKWLQIYPTLLGQRSIWQTGEQT